MTVGSVAIEEVLLILKIAFLVLLYLFIWRIVRSAARDLRPALATNAIVHEPEPRTGAPDTNDDHLWSLVQSEANCVLVTGDHALVASPPPKAHVLQPRQFVDLLPE